MAGNAAFVHDTPMIPECGTSRADFPGGSAAARCEATVADHRATNIHVGEGATRNGFIAVREARDVSLRLPDRMLAALQVNMRGGRLPEPEPDGRRYLKIPVDRFGAG